MALPHYSAMLARRYFDVVRLHTTVSYVDQTYCSTFMALRRRTLYDSIIIQRKSRDLLIRRYAGQPTNVLIPESKQCYLIRRVLASVSGRFCSECRYVSNLIYELL